ncbi:MAG TPA: hypothetical protein VFA66_08095 [Gaiellaceae bacterium]|nr:hypothetical protein [Gaiellaceae bacterium]
MVAFFMRFLRHYFEISEADVRLACNLFADHEPRQREIEEFWLATVRLPRSCMTRTTVNRYSRSSKGTRKNRLPYGPCRVTVHSTRVVQHIYGAIQEYASFDRDVCLD